MAKQIKRMRLEVHTIRYGVTEPEVESFVAQYLSDERGRKRFDADAFSKSGKSRTMIVEDGMKIETIIQLSRME
jgi:hypothetical protein